MKSDEDVREDLFHNIVLSGGSTMFPGIRERMHKEISSLAPATVDVKVIAPPERKFLVWNGGSVLATLPTFNMMWVQRHEYDENGSRIFDAKCL